MFLLFITVNVLNNKILSCKRLQISEPLTWKPWKLRSLESSASSRSWKHYVVMSATLCSWSSRIQSRWNQRIIERRLSSGVFLTKKSLYLNTNDNDRAQITARKHFSAWNRWNRFYQWNASVISDLGEWRMIQFLESGYLILELWGGEGVQGTEWESLIVWKQLRIGLTSGKTLSPSIHKSSDSQICV